MGKKLFISEKPSVAQEFARALGVKGVRHDGYLENDEYIVTWCVGHLVTMSYPEAYDPALKKWSLSTIPFLPKTFKYEVIPGVKKQFKIVSSLLERDDVDVIYICTDSGREGEYIYRLVAMMCGPKVTNKKQLRVWIDSFTDEEIGRGIREAKPDSEYDHISDAAYLRAKEDYLMGINFSRLLTLCYGDSIASFRHERYTVISCGRVMTCVLGMVVKREREIRAFVKEPFYRVLGTFGGIEAEWRVQKGSAYENSPKLYKDNGFKEKKDAGTLIDGLKRIDPQEGLITACTHKTEKKNPPLLYNLAELQNDCSRFFKISPDQTLSIAQELYEKKLTTYPRTDARVLSSAVAKEIDKNIRGLLRYETAAPFAAEVLNGTAYKKIGSTRYTNDRAITDHYAIIPTGFGLNALDGLSPMTRKVYERIVRRFLAIFYPPAEYSKTNLTIRIGRESFFASEKLLVKEGYFKVTGRPKADDQKENGTKVDYKSLKKGMTLPVEGYEIKEGETSPPKRYTSGSMILAMENAGQLIEDDDLREQIKGAGIGTSATRAEILKKLVKIQYLNLNGKTQVITPSLLGEMVYDVVRVSIPPLLNPSLTASWEKGLSGVAEGTISTDEYMEKLEGFITRRCDFVKTHNYSRYLQGFFNEAAKYNHDAPHTVKKPARRRRSTTGKTGKSTSGRRKRRTANGTS